MARQRTDSVLVVKFADESSRRTPDRLVVEEPMSIRLDGELVATTMRTPGNDFELAAGFCFADGLLNGVPVTGVRYCADGSAVESAFNVVTVETGGRAPTPTPRLGNTTSSCGLCGSQTLDELVQRLSPLDNGRLPDFPIPPHWTR
ncbi:MAG: formate dehydrogenase accessory sulfurtransferase FdhD [Ilumatobacteraceae bacterium]